MKTGSNTTTSPQNIWQWPVDLNRYDRTAWLRPAERETMGRLLTHFAAGGKGWHTEARGSLQRLLLPLEDTLDYLGAVNSIRCQYLIRTTVICLLLRAMHQHDCSFWAFPTSVWHELLGQDYYAYLRQHGATCNARQQLIGVAYLLCGFEELSALGRLAYHLLAQKIFGTNVIAPMVADLLQDLRTWGYTQKGNTLALKNSLAEALLMQRSPLLTDLRFETLSALHQRTEGKITRRGLVILSYALVRRGLIPYPLGRDGQQTTKERLEHRQATEGVPQWWLSWCERWFATSPLQRNTRISSVYRLFQVGRWLAQTHPEQTALTDWTRERAAEFVGAVTRATIGQWSTVNGVNQLRLGQPLGAKSKEGLLKTLRSFLADCQEWGWASFRFHPARAFATPRSIRALLGPNPRVIADATWAKLIWAGLHLTDRELSRSDEMSHPGDPLFYPAAMIRALIAVWLFTGLRRSEIVRLRLGCIRWQTSPDRKEGGKNTGEPSLCLLDVPVHKTGTAFTKPVDPLVGQRIAAWEAMRPPQPLWLDPKTGERVHLLFSHRGRGVSMAYLNRTLIPLLCRKAGVPREDTRGRITSHRARATIASQLYNAKEPLSLFELQEWLGHRSPETTRHYTKISPTKLAQSYTDAGYFARNVRAVEILLDQDLIRNGRAVSEPWKYYDLGHGYCTYDFFDQCPHRMACAKCSFYVPKESSRAQLLEAKANLQRMKQEIPLQEEERAAVEDGLIALEKLYVQLADVPTPAGPTPRELKQGYRSSTGRKHLHSSAK